jgi:hypothetical protein
LTPGNAEGPLESRSGSTPQPRVALSLAKGAPWVLESTTLGYAESVTQLV